MASLERISAGIRYEPNENPSLPLAFGLGLQLVILNVAGIVLTPAIVIRAAGTGEAYMSWAVFAAVLISGATTILQAVRLGRLGSGYVLAMGTSGAFIAVCVTALAKGGPGMLATLIIISSLFQFFLSEKLSLFRRVLTPTVSGVVIMLIAVTIMPFMFDGLTDVPEGSPPLAAPMSALATVVAIMFIALKATGSMRLWAPVIGVLVGAVVSMLFGIYDTGRVAEAAWIGFPEVAWSGFDLSFGTAFWALLPGFVLVTLIGAVETIGDAVAIQNVSWRKPRAVDFRAVQGAVGADGVGNLLSGLLSTVPNTTYSSSISVTELTGVASRKVGVASGIIFILIAFFPKFLASILAIPGPVSSAYITILLAMLFVVGMQIVVKDGLNYRKSLVVGMAFWIGVGFQNGVIYPEYFAELAGGLFNNGMTAGGLAAIIMTLFLELTESHRSRREFAFDTSALPKIKEFLVEFVSARGMESTVANQVYAAGEEALLTLLREQVGGLGEEGKRQRLFLTARREEDTVILDFIASGGMDNLEDKMALLGEREMGGFVEQEVSLRILRHLASSVRHQQYHDADIVTIRVDVGGGER